MPEEKKTMHLTDGGLIIWTHDGREYALLTETDTCPSNPRDRDEDRSLIGRMYCHHGRYDLGDYGKNTSVGTFWRNLIQDAVPIDVIAARLKDGTVPGYAREDDPADAFLSDLEDGEAECSSAAKMIEGYAVVLPLWLYDHSGITMSCGDRVYPYNDRWDSSAIGWIAVTKADMTSKLSMDHGEEWTEKALEIAKSEVQEYDAWLTGDIWWYRLSSRPIPEDGAGPVSPEDDWDEEDSCGGFVGSDLLSNGILDYAGHGLDEAITSGSYSTGHVKSHTITVREYVKD